MDSSAAAQYLIEHNNFMTIATANAAGKPWVSPVGFVYDDDYNLYWISYKEALHSVSIGSRPEVAIVIFGQMPAGNYDGVYLDATASELTEPADLQAAIDLFKARRPQPDRFQAKSPADLTGDAAWRMYKAVPQQVSKRSDDTVNGQAITVRQNVQL